MQVHQRRDPGCERAQLGAHIAALPGMASPVKASDAVFPPGLQALFERRIRPWMERLFNRP